MTVSPDTRPLAPASVTSALGVLRAGGHRISAARRLVLEALFAADGPVSADRLAGGLDGRLPARTSPRCTATSTRWPRPGSSSTCTCRTAPGSTCSPAAPTAGRRARPAGASTRSAAAPPPGCARRCAARPASRPASPTSRSSGVCPGARAVMSARSAASSAASAWRSPRCTSPARRCCSRSRAATAGAITVGAGLTAYTLGLRHAFDADHIAAIDNTTRKLMAAGRRPLSVGFFFALGHSTVVLVLALLLAAGVRALGGAVQDEGSALQETTGLVGTLVSGSFLYAIGILNLAAADRDRARAAARPPRRADRGAARGRARAARAAEPDLRPAHAAGAQAVAHVPARACCSGSASTPRPRSRCSCSPPARRSPGCRSTRSLCLPVLFAAGMALLDTIDGAFMGFAYDWALARPVRRLYYNLTVTGLSVAVALGIGTVELLSVLGLSGRRPRLGRLRGRRRCSRSRGRWRSPSGGWGGSSSAGRCRPVADPTYDGTAQNLVPFPAPMGARGTSRRPRAPAGCSRSRTT